MTRSSICAAPRLTGGTLLAPLLASLLYVPGATADQLDPTITTNYPADPTDEKVYTFIPDGSFSGPAVHSYTVDNSEDSTAASGGSFLLCGTNDCAADSGNEPGSRDGSLDGYAEVTVLEENATGSGLFRPFKREQHNEMSQNGNNTYQTSYNTDDDNLQSKNDPGGGSDYDYENMVKDTGAGPGEDFNHAIIWDNELASADTFKLLFDINESENTSEILLDEASLWVSTSNELSVYDPGCNYTKTAGTSGSNGCFNDSENPGQAIKIWDMDIDQLVAALMLDNTVDKGMAGSGDYDAIFTFDTKLVNDAIAALGGSGQYYVYWETTEGLAEAVSTPGDCQYRPNGTPFKCTGGEVDAGFEEWAIMAGGRGGDVPSPAPLALIGGMLGLMGLHRKFRIKR